LLRILRAKNYSTTIFCTVPFNCTKYIPRGNSMVSLPSIALHNLLDLVLKNKSISSMCLIYVWLMFFSVFVFVDLWGYYGGQDSGFSEMKEKNVKQFLALQK